MKQLVIDATRNLTIAILFLMHPTVQGADVAPSFDNSVIDRAMSLPILTFDRSTNYNHSIGPAAHYLSIIAYLDSEAKSSDGELVAKKVIANLTNVVAAGHEPELKGIMFSWADHHLGGIIALAKYTPAVWDQLSSDTKERLDWIMRVGTYVGNIQHNAANQCYRDITMSASGNYNPNQRNPMVAWMSYAYIYFGGAPYVNAVLASYDYTKMMDALASYGWPRLADSFDGEDTRRLMNEGGVDSSGRCTVNPEGVRKAFTFKGKNVFNTDGCPSWPVASTEVPYDPVSLLRREEYEYNLAAQVVDEACKVSTGCDVAGHIKEGFTSPHLGKIGMFLEYNLNGRSSPGYVAWGAKNALFHLATVIAGGFWETGRESYDEITNRFSIAIEVWQYRVDGKKWYDTSHCGFASGPSLFMGSDFALDLWDSMVSSGVRWPNKPITDIEAPIIRLKN